MLRTVDADVLVLAISASAKYDDKYIYVDFGVGKNRKMLSAHNIQLQIGKEKADVLPVFHAFTGCDTVSSFKSIGKKTAWERWSNFDKVTEAFKVLSKGPEDIDIHTQKLIERFVVLLYHKNSGCTSVNGLRKELLTGGRSIEIIPPTSGALLQHDRRTAYQGGYLWGNASVKQQNLPEAEQWGWCKDNEGQYKPLWSKDPIASKGCKQLVRCKCSGKHGLFKCTGRCSCKGMKQPCTDLCQCKGTCDYSKTFSNKEASIEEAISDNDDDETEDNDNNSEMNESFDNSFSEELEFDLEC